MNKVQRDLDQKVRAVNKLNHKVKRKQVEHSNVLKNDCFQFPLIRSVVMTFPACSMVPRTTAVHSVHKPNKKVQLQLQQILTRNNVHLNGCNISKVIFGGPMKSRISLDSTFRSSFGLNGSNKNKTYRSLSRSKLINKNKQQNTSRTLEPQQLSESQLITDSLAELHSLTPQVQIAKTKYGHMDKIDHFKDINITTHMNNSYKRTRKNRLNPQSLKHTLGRYSPWGHRENDDELII